MNKIIAIYGKSNSGKTSTIVEIDKLLIKKYKFDVKVIDKIGKDIFHILFNKTIKIGIISQGDVGSWLEEYLKILSINKCNIIICATHTRGKTCNAVNKYYKKYEIIWEEIEYFEKSPKNPIKFKTINRIMKFITDNI